MTLIDLESNMANIKGDAGVEVIPNAAVEVILNAGVNNIPKAGVDVISKDALTRLRRGARFTTYVPKMLK
jgi:hypothetical protein